MTVIVAMWVTTSMLLIMWVNTMWGQVPQTVTEMLGKWRGIWRVVALFFHPVGEEAE